MRIPLCSGKYHTALVSIFLIVTVLVAGAAACDGARTYQLTVSGGSGGNVTAPGEGTFPCAAGTVVPLVATPNNGYGFRSWSGDTQGITDRNAASTTIAMNGDYAILANFETEDGTGPGDGGGPVTP